jgi:hypothetical protein
VWAGGNRHHCRDWGGDTGVDLIQVSLSTREQQRARGQFSAKGEPTSVCRRELFVAPREVESSKGEGKKGGKGNHGQWSGTVALHCIASKDGAPSPHRTTLLRRAGRERMFVVCVFIVLHFPFFLFENHHSITENSGSSFHAFSLNLPLSLSDCSSPFFFFALFYHMYKGNTTEVHWEWWLELPVFFFDYFSAEVVC